MDYLKLAEELHLSAEDIREMVNNERERVTAEFLEDLLADICNQPSEADKKIFEKATLFQKLLYVAMECYIKGYAMGVYSLNDALSIFCKEAQRELELGQQAPAANLHSA